MCVENRETSSEEFGAWLPALLISLGGRIGRPRNLTVPRR